MEIQLNLGSSTTATFYQPQVGNPRMTSWTKPVVNGKVTVPVSETPMFVQGN